MSISGVLSGRTHSSRATPSSGATSASKRPACQAAAALWCEETANSSIRARVSDHLAAISSALIPWGTRPSG